MILFRMFTFSQPEAMNMPDDWLKAMVLLTIVILFVLSSRLRPTTVFFTIVFLMVMPELFFV